MCRITKRTITYAVSRSYDYQSVRYEESVEIDVSGLADAEAGEEVKAERARLCKMVNRIADYAIHVLRPDMPPSEEGIK